MEVFIGTVIGVVVGGFFMATLVLNESTYNRQIISGESFALEYSVYNCKPVMKLGKETE